MTRIVHFSDWHWGFRKLPEADLYVSTGDMYDNYLRLTKIKKKDREKVRYLGMDGHGGSFLIDKAHEKRMQECAATKFKKAGGFRQCLGSPDAPIVCVNGNHDFADGKRLFSDCNFVHEFVNNEVIEVAGLKITGHRGVPPINGMWADETPEPDLIERWRAMDPDCDLYLTHYPAGGVGLDLPGRWGLDECENWLYYTAKRHHIIHMAGHIHECGGMTIRRGDIWFSNAATSYNVFEGDPVSGWKDVTGL